MNKDHLINELLKFKEKAGCHVASEEAQLIWQKLYPKIPEPFKFTIRIEWGHVQMGHGYKTDYTALDEEINKCIQHLKNI
ncbi:hypothetical protein [Candidatus Formimonas warabiya]|nr:hypothetical protein [Candidatus Formimonas warabiya]